MEITLSKNKIAIIDDEDFEKIANFRWYAKYNNGRWKAVARITENGKRKMLFMHRLILDPKKDDVIIHLNGDSLDNRKDNLRMGDTMIRGMYKRTQKNKTHSKYKGVCFHKGRNKWCAHIGTEKKRLFLGLYETEREAAEAYDCAALYYFKEFAQTNGIGHMPKSKEQIAADRKAKTRPGFQAPKTKPVEGPKPRDHWTKLLRRDGAVFVLADPREKELELALERLAPIDNSPSHAPDHDTGWRVQSLDFQYLEGLGGCDPMLGF